MYIALLLALLALSAFLFLTGSKKEQRIKKYSGIVLAVLSLGLFWFMDFWGEALWFENLGYGNRFWTIINSQGTLMIAGALFGLLAIFLFTIGIPKKHKIILTLTKLLAIVLGGFWGSSNWETILKFWYGVSTGLKDPILGKDVGFYLFSLPFYDILFDSVLVIH